MVIKINTSFELYIALITSLARVKSLYFTIIVSIHEDFVHFMILIKPDRIFATSVVLLSLHVSVQKDA